MKYLLAIFLLLNTLHSCAQDGEVREVIEDRLLRWSDFRGHSDLDTFFANVYTHMDYAPKNMNVSDTIPFFKAACYFLPNSSTVSKKLLMEKPDSVRKRVLSHEQGHYNISRIGTAEINAGFRNFKFDLKRCMQQADSLFHSVRRRVIVMQQQYDDETNHSRNRAEQQRWDTLIKMGMEKKQLPAVRNKNILSTQHTKAK